MNRCQRCGVRLLDSQPRDCWTCEDPPPLWFGLMLLFGLPVGFVLACATCG